MEVSAPPLHAAPLKTVPDIQKWPDNSQYSPLDPEIGAWYPDMVQGTLSRAPRHPDMAPRHPEIGAWYPDMVQGARDIDAMHVGRKMWMNGFCSSMKKGQNTRAKHPDTCA